MKIGIIGLGFVGGSMYKSFEYKGLIPNDNLFGYDKFCLERGTGKLEDMYKCDILFLALPTKYNKEKGEYNKDSIYETCDNLLENEYKGVIVVKSTVEPETTDKLSDKYEKLEFVHNPEFLTAATAYEDFHNQYHIVLGKGPTCSETNYNKVIEFYKEYYSDNISESTSLESESMKIFVNCFYSVKIQFFNELYALCKSNNCDYDKVLDMMLKNEWINPMHTKVPGTDGQISYGGLCFPKDTNALNMYMKRMNTPNKVLESTIIERNEMRDDHDNCD